MNDDSILKFSDIEDENQREKEIRRFHARLDRSKSLTPYFTFINSQALRYYNAGTASNYIVRLGLTHVPRKPRNIESFDNELYTLRSGSVRSNPSNDPANLRAISCTCPDYTKRTELNAGRHAWDGGPCVSNAYGCKHMMAANMFLGLPATIPTDVD